MGERPEAALCDGVGLLERALSFTLGSIRVVTPELMRAPTPCRAWDLHALLAHMTDSLATLGEAIDGQVDPAVDVTDPGVDPVTTLRGLARGLVGSWSRGWDTGAVLVGGLPLPASIVAEAGAVEVAVHGWDVAQACRIDRPIPSALAEELLQIAHSVVAGSDRPARFAPPVEVPPLATASDRLLAYLGRRPLQGAGW